MKKSQLLPFVDAYLEHNGNRDRVPLVRAMIITEDTGPFTICHCEFEAAQSPHMLDVGDKVKVINSSDASQWFEALVEQETTPGMYLFTSTGPLYGIIVNAADAVLSSDAKDLKDAEGPVLLIGQENPADNGVYISKDGKLTREGQDADTPTIVEHNQ